MITTTDDMRRFGADVQIDETARILRPDLLSLGSHVRIDAGVIISGPFPVEIGAHVHLAPGSKIFASGGPVVLDDFTGLASDAKVYTATDDYLGGSLTNPTVPDGFRNVKVGPVVLEEHVIIGAGSIVLPGVTLRYGAAVGALSLVRGDVGPGLVVSGVPARPIWGRDLSRLRRLADEVRLQASPGGAGSE